MSSSRPIIKHRSGSGADRIITRSSVHRFGSTQAVMCCARLAAGSALHLRDWFMSIIAAVYPILSWRSILIPGLCGQRLARVAEISVTLIKATGALHWWICKMYLWASNFNGLEMFCVKASFKKNWPRMEASSVIRMRALEHGHVALMCLLPIKL